MLADGSELEGVGFERTLAHDDLQPVLRARSRNRIDPARQRQLHRPTPVVHVVLRARGQRLGLIEDIALQAVGQIEQSDVEISVRGVLQVHEHVWRLAVRPVRDGVLTGESERLPIGRQGRLAWAGWVDPELHRVGESRTVAAELTELLPTCHVLQLLHRRRRGAGRISAGNRRCRGGDGR